MLGTIKSFFKKILDVFAVTDDRYTIKQVPKTANEAGRVYCLTETATGEDWNIFVCRRDEGGSDLSSPSTKYVVYEIVAERSTHSQRTAKFTTIKDPQTGKPLPLDPDHHGALVSYFEARGIQVVRLYPPRPANGRVPVSVAAPTNGDGFAPAMI